MPSAVTRVVQSRYTGQATAGSTSHEVVSRAPFTGTVSQVTVAPDAAMTGATATARTIRVLNKGQAGAGTAVVATKAYITGQNLVADDENDVTISAVAADVAVVEGDMLALDTTVAGAGTVLPPGLVLIRYVATD